MIVFDTGEIAWVALFIAICALALSVGLAVKLLLDRPRHQHGPEVEDIDAIWRRDLSDETVPIPHTGTIHRSRNG